MRKIISARQSRRPRVLFIPILDKSIEYDISLFPPNVKHPGARNPGNNYTEPQRKTYLEAGEIKKGRIQPQTFTDRTDFLVSNVYFVRVGPCRPRWF
jgi:hypothetical protein